MADMRHGVIKNSKNPFMIGFAENKVMGCFDLVIQIGGLKDEAEAKKLADLVAEWLIEEGGWKQRVQ